MTSRPLYDILGLQPDATQEAIEKAYKRLAREHHPDRGGDEEDFEPIAEAYSVLGDPSRRSRYDLDGRWDNGAKVDNAMLSVLSLLSTTLVEVMTKRQPDDDIRQAMMDHLVEAWQAAISPVSKLEMAKAQFEKLAGRWTTSGEPNLMEEVVSQHIGKIQDEIDQAQAEAVRFDKAIEVLKKYKYRFDSTGGLFMPGSWREMMPKIDGRY